MKTILRNFTLVIVVLGTVQAANYLSEKPTHLTPCFTTKPDFNQCYAKNIQSLFREWKDGIPGLKSVGTLEPIRIKHIKVTHNANTLILHIDMKNVTARGGSTAIVQEALFDTKTMITSQKYFVPKLFISCDFKAEGLVLGFNFSTQGSAQFESDNQVIALKAGLKIRREHGHTFTDVTNLKIQIIKFDDFQLHFKNLFGSNKILENSANELLNTNWREVYPLFKPIIEKTLEGVFLDRLKKVLAYVPAEYFFADLPEA